MQGHRRDLVLAGGSVLDGTGAAPVTADVRVSAGRIVEVGQLGVADSPGTLVRDVTGCVLAPGFIDLHSHSDFTLFSAPDAVTQATQGVTTLVTGNCGFSPFPVTDRYAADLREMSGFLDDGLPWTWSSAREYAEALSGLGLGVNVAPLVGHGALRIAAMGAEDRAPDDAELARMRRLLAESLSVSPGMSTGLIYAPGLYAGTDEIVALARETVAAGGFYATHMRDEQDHLFEAITEALTIARRSGVRLQLSHLKASRQRNWGKVSEALRMVDAARVDGLDVAVDQYPYTASSTTLTTFLPSWAMDGGTPALLGRLADPQVSARILDEVDIDGDRVVLADTGPGPYAAALGRSIAEIAGEAGVGVEHAVLDVLRAQQGRTGIVHHSMAEDDVRTVLRHPLVAVASDSHTPGCPGRGNPHPRGLGTFTRVLGRYARDEGVLGLADAVRKMTALPASRLGWSDRGVIRPGAVADLVVFDPTTVIDRADFGDPWRLSTGVLDTFVAGTATLWQGEPTGAGPGTVLR